MKTRSRSLTVAQARPLPRSACRSIRLPPFNNDDIRVRARVQAKLCLHAAGPSTDSLTLARPTVARSRWSQAARPRRGQGSLDVPVCCNHTGDHHLGCVPPLLPFSRLPLTRCPSLRVCRIAVLCLSLFFGSTWPTSVLTALPPCPFAQGWNSALLRTRSPCSSLLS